MPNVFHKLFMLKLYSYRLWIVMHHAELKLTRVQRSPLVIIARARREGPGDEATTKIHVCYIINLHCTCFMAMVGWVTLPFFSFLFL